jgi:hypothetical protein
MASIMQPIQGVKRVLAAPYQSGTSRSPNRSASNTPPRGNGDGNQLPIDSNVDYRSFQFQELEKTNVVAFEKYCGPTPESNWVVPGKLLVGAYPASNDDEETLCLITSILRWGITKFVCLQQEYREHGVTEAMWRSGQALRPYFHDVRSIVKKKALIPSLRNYPVVDEEDLNFVHFPIRDCGITDDDGVLELARSLVKSIAEGEVIYLHCWGGHGRTGTLVCIMLHLMYGYTDTEAMQYCQAVHDLRQCPVVVGSPQTQTQRDQVSRIVQKLITQSRFRSRTMSGDGSMLSGRAERVEMNINLNNPTMQTTLASTLASPRAEMTASGNQATNCNNEPEDSTTPPPEGANDENVVLSTPIGTSTSSSNVVTGAEGGSIHNSLESDAMVTSPVVQNPTLTLDSTTTNQNDDMMTATPESNSPTDNYSNSNDDDTAIGISMSEKFLGDGDEASDSNMQVDNAAGVDLDSQAQNNNPEEDEVEETEQDDGGDEIRPAEDIDGDGTTSIAYPPEQVKPSFAFTRKGLTPGNQQ